jgi:23S rRNA (guanosine2251-2'-O)-methyltransferase
MTKQKHAVIFGIHAVTTLLQKNPERAFRLYVQKDKQDHKTLSLLDLAESLNIKISFSTRDELDHLSDHSVHQGIIAACQAAKNYSEQDLSELLENLPTKPFLLILDGVQDPHNLGACLRSADAAGVHAVIAPKDKSVGLSPTVCKVACGAAETVPFIQVTNLARTMRFLKENNIWIFGATDDASKKLYDENFKIPVAIALGSEGEGLRRLTRDLCDELLTIPMQGTVSSLNVSVATGVFLFEVVRQRG